ncbi:hypothetical protein J694_2356 [Acinetobacter sp. 1281984]|jgi:hypothetical protein|nr:hypothetical protein J514_0213 [Acinetobacter sp. 1396970]EXH15421.1 hypothetical protein J627_1173 [Acinetobacter sp. 1245593]EXI13349.1 hypothetical protein J604_0857 [Acinetobacter sp. 694762]EXR27785.1 hypothetical protein J694_2356 [Acinetobacter sp. 1281984]EXS46789.1 hypothetical protein J660_1441 [Acinetobacter sp. 88816]
MRKPRIVKKVSFRLCPVEWHATRTRSKNSYNLAKNEQFGSKFTD